MARMHSRRKGESGSVRPPSKSAPPWVEATKEEAIALIEKYCKEDKTPAQIGELLRDAHGIPSFKALAGKTITQVLEQLKIGPKYPSDLLSLIKKAVKLRTHLAIRKKDTLNKAMLVRTESKIRRLVKYYRGYKLAQDWKYDPEKAALLVK